MGRIRAALLLFLGLTAAACDAPDVDAPDLEEQPPGVEVISRALSSINCTETKDTGYRNGTSFAITVVTVDGRKVERESANAYYVMAKAAAAAGVNIAVVSGFRTQAQQQYLYSCYVNCNCNNCNLAAKPGYSNHQSGHAFDLNTSAGGVLNWLNANGARFGFKRTVPSEVWHWEWWGGGPGGGPCTGPATNTAPPAAKPDAGAAMDARGAERPAIAPPPPDGGPAGTPEPPAPEEDPIDEIVPPDRGVSDGQEEAHTTGPLIGEVGCSVARTPGPAKELPIMCLLLGAGLAARRLVRRRPQKRI